MPEGLTFSVGDSLLVHREQDYRAMVSQGPRFDRSSEKLGKSDEGVIMLRKLIFDAIGDVKKGIDPKGVIRRRDKKEIIDLESIVADHIDQSTLIQPFGASENR